MASCSTCGRNFNVDRLAKHEAICQKTAAKKRKVFDATTHRLMGTDAEQFVQKQLRSQRIAVPTVKSTGAAVITASAIEKLAAARRSPPPKRSDWRRKHEEFIATIRSAKQVKEHLARGGKLSDLPPPPPSENPDYVQCPHCQRRFNEGAAERHIPKCATFQHNKPKVAAPRKKY